MFKQQKGITLIALVITIIVLLILAGITIAMLTGSDSAPAKANEAKQKQDIGSAKDQIYMIAQNAQLKYYDDTYVKAGSTGSGDAITAAKTAVGKYVADEITTHLATTANTKVGDATLAITTAAQTTNSETGTCLVLTITTRDYNVTGTVKGNGSISWSAIGTNS